MQTSLPSLAALSFAARKRVVDRNPLESTSDDDSSPDARSRTKNDDEPGPSRREEDASRAEAAARDDETVPEKIPPYKDFDTMNGALSRVLGNLDAFRRFQRHLFPRYQNTPRGAMAALPSLAGLRPENVYDFGGEVLRSDDLRAWKKSFERMIEIIQTTMVAQVKLKKTRIATIGYNSNSKRYILTSGEDREEYLNDESLRDALQSLLEDDKRVENVYDVYFVV